MTTTDPKSAMPDEVEKAFSGIVSTMASACFDQRAVRESVSEKTNTIRAHIAALEADNKRLREESAWHTKEIPQFDITVMVERESGGFWWGQFVLGGWHLKYGDGWISADDVIAWRYLPSSSKTALSELRARRDAESRRETMTEAELEEKVWNMLTLGGFTMKQRFTSLVKLAKKFRG